MVIFLQKCLLFRLHFGRRIEDPFVKELISWKNIYPCRARCEQRLNNLVTYIKPENCVNSCVQMSEVIWVLCINVKQYGTGIAANAVPQGLTCLDGILCGRAVRPILGWLKIAFTSATMSNINLFTIYRKKYGFMIFSILQRLFFAASQSQWKFRWWN